MDLFLGVWDDQLVEEEEVPPSKEYVISLNVDAQVEPKGDKAVVDETPKEDHARQESASKERWVL